ncbi:hypothetical protein D6C83_00027 [Aureobasidium pullulans]|uniref:Uncharacterized protein n=1 Tax=Aureobasidium pullulans TaxID=5580 RepID=A0A4T0EP76_AURPU|nr:hypothetical protein D6C83_00027 [Aureobasidium pullulans]
MQLLVLVPSASDASYFSIHNRYQNSALFIPATCLNKSSQGTIVVRLGLCPLRATTPAHYLCRKTSCFPTVAFGLVGNLASNAKMSNLATLSWINQLPRCRLLLKLL